MLLQLEYKHKIIRIELGDPHCDEVQHEVVIRFDNFKHIILGTETMEHCKLFDLS